MDRNYRYSYSSSDTDDMYKKSRSEKLMEARQAFMTDGRGHHIKSKSADIKDRKADEEGYSFGMLRLITAGVLFLILGIAFYNNFSYNGFDKNYIIERLEKSEYWDAIVENVGEAASGIVKWYNSVGD